MSPLLTPTQVASWLNVSERTIARMVKAGRLPRPTLISNRPRFSADVILPQILQDGDVKFMGGITLDTHDGPICFEVLEASYKLQRFGKQWAIVKDYGKRLHILPWKDAFVFLPDHMDHPPFIVSCEDDDVQEFPLGELHLEIWTAPDGFFERLTDEGFYEMPGTRRSEWSVH